MPDFIFFAHFLRRRAWLLLAAPILYGLVAFGWSQRLAPVYQAQAMLQVSPASLSSGDIGAIAASERLASTYAQIIVQPATLEATIARLSQDGAAPTWPLAVTAEPIRETQLIRLRVEGPSPAAAAQVADAVAQTFIETNRMRQVARFAASKTNLEQQMAALETQIKQEAAGSASPEVLSRLRQSLSALTASYETVRLAEAQASDNVTVVQPARASARPLRPRPLFNALAAAIVGLMMALAAALLLEALDDRLNSAERVTAAIALPVLATVGRSSGLDQSGLVISQAPHSAAAEAYRMLRANLRFTSLDRPLRTLSVVSAEPGEGKTTTAANLAVALAHAGQRVILVDADLRRPRLHTVFGVSNNLGLTTALLPDGGPLTAHLQPTAVPGLHLLTSGPQPPNPAELIGSERMVALLSDLRQAADVIVLDTPPVLAVADAALLAHASDATLLVVDAQGTRRRSAQRAMALLTTAGAHVVGAVLNRLPLPAGTYGQYYGPTAP
ncbi:polysaccharide biosynthesis tyrosine autokinase [Candidatus Amarolinea dominans]|uniref:polysaccharide biosynthesis tyrosine autokinase n=1 Tax=Candidatus Amarolinea dominans TaxID=3140696 RepID=UPI0031350E1A|nr:polysaccharide biosynthesis tyrosine autokinase [Anaerolineae bacterium]